MEDKETKINRIYKVIMLVALSIFITFMVTSLSLYSQFTKAPIYTIFKGNSSSSSIESNDLDQYLENIKQLIDTQYLWVKDIDENELKEKAVQGYVSGLNDKYTEYIPADEMKKYTENIIGTFVGVGVYMIADENTQKIYVYYPIPESPAEEAGILPGDIIKSVDGIEYSFEEFDIVAEKIRGKEGSTVTLVLERDGKDMTFKIVRRKINTNPVTAKIIEKNIGYLRIPSFDSGTADNFKEKVEDLIEKGAKSLIIDLRNNGGGIVVESTNIADLLLDKDKTILITRDNNDNKEITKCKEEKLTDVPIVVLVNENSASASEILTGALKDNKRATIVGTNTYGKGVIQTIYTLPDGSGLKITTAEYYTPSETAIHGVGIKPDIETKLPDSVENLYSVDEKNDTQLKKAIEQLKK